MPHAPPRHADSRTRHGDRAAHVKRISRVLDGALVLPGRGELSGGLSTAFLVLPTILSCGTVSFQTLGPDYVARGVSAAFLTAILAALFAWLFDGRIMHVNSPKTSHAALLSLLMAELAASGPFARAAAGGPGGLPFALIGAALAALFSAGLAQFMIGALGLGRLVRLLPRPVLAGLVNGFGLQIILSQVPRAFGAGSMRDMQHVITDAAGGAVPWPLLLAVVAGIATLFGRRLTKIVPTPLMGLAAGSVAALGLDLVLPAGAGGPPVGSIGIDLTVLSSIPDSVLHQSGTVLGLAALPVLQTGITLALVAAVQALLAMAASDAVTNQRHDPDRVLMAQGGANILVACIGGAPTGGSINTARAAYVAGARTRAVNLSHALSLIVLLAFASGAIAVIPLSVMAAVVIVSTLGALDNWSLTLLRRTALHERKLSSARQWLDIATVVLVAILLLRDGALVALTAGFAVTTVSLLGRLVQVFVRDVAYGDTQRSRTTRDDAAAETLRQQGRRIAILSLQGPLSFATAEPLFDRLEAMTSTSDSIILDASGVTDADITGVFALGRIRSMIKAEGATLYLAGITVTPRLTAMFAEAGVKLTPDWHFATRHEALCQAEDDLLRRLAPGAQGTGELGITAIIGGLTQAEAALMEQYGEKRTYQAGAVIIRAGDPGDVFYLLCAGSIGVFGSSDGRRVVLARDTAGSIFGEMALLTGQPRSADVEALTPVLVRAFSAEAMQAIRKIEPQVNYKVMRAIARQISRRNAELSRTVVALGG